MCEESARNLENLGAPGVGNLRAPVWKPLVPPFYHHSMALRLSPTGPAEVIPIQHGCSPSFSLQVRALTTRVSDVVVALRSKRLVRLF